MDPVEVHQGFVDHTALTVIHPVDDHRDGLFDADTREIRTDSPQADVQSGAAVAAGKDQIRQRVGQLPPGC